MLKKIMCMGALLIFTGMTVLVAQSPLDKAKSLILNEKLSLAEAELDQLITKVPSDKALQKVEHEIYYWRGKVSLLKENFNEARAFFERGVLAAKKSPMNKAGLARIAINDGKLDQALALLEVARGMNKNKNAFADFEIAEAYLQGNSDMRGSGNVILQKYMEDGSLTPPKGSEAIPYILSGTYYKKQNIIELGIEGLEKALEISPNYVPAIASLAELYFDQGRETKQAADFNTALEYANQAINLDADYAPAYRIRAEIKLLLNNFEAARDDMQKYVSETQGDLKARERYAAFLYLSGDHAQSLEEINAINQAGLNTQVLRRLKGLNLVELGRLDEALTAMEVYFDALSSEDFAIATDYEALGDIYRLKGDLEKASEYYGKMILKNPDRADKFAVLADTYKDSANYYKEQRLALKATVSEKQEEINTTRAAYNACAAVNDSTCADSLRPIYQALVAEAKDLINVQYPALEEKEISFYPTEAFYRAKDIEATEPSLRRYYRLGIAYYNGKMFTEANDAFKKCHELDDMLEKPFVSAYSYRFQIAGKVDTETDQTMTQEVGMDVYKEWEGVAAADLDDQAKALMKGAMGQLIQTTYDESLNDGKGGYDCEKACPYVDRFLEVDPANEDVASLRDFCKCEG